jgi:hypothetical protein
VFSMNFGSRGSTASKEKSAATLKITCWINARIENYASDVGSIHVMVTELECNDPDCVPLETLVALLGKDVRWTSKILKPLNEVTQRDVEILPFPPSWSSYETEQVFIKSNPEMYLWMTRTSDEFEKKLGDLNEEDSLQAIKLMGRLMSEMQTNYLDADINISGVSDPLPSMNDKVASTVTSTMVPMRLKSISDIVPLSMGKGAMTRNVSASDCRIAEIDLADVVASCPAVEVSTQIIQMPTPANVTTIPAAVAVDDVLESLKGQSPEVTKILRLEDTRSPFPLISSTTAAAGLQKRHKKGTRPRGCPCCDPSNIDNILDKMIFLEAPP